MKKLLLGTVLLIFGAAVQAQPPVAATLTEAALPAVAGPVAQPQNTSASTLQQISFVGSINNFYLHSWDIGGIGTRGIAWRRTNASGTLINQGYVALSNVFDIDVALYKRGDSVFALAAYYFLGTSSIPSGYYYNTYRFTATGFSLTSSMNLLQTSPSHAGINVDVNDVTMDLAITWCRPGSGIYVKVIQTSGSITGPNVQLPETADLTDPDICINRESTGPWLHIVGRHVSLNSIRVMRLHFNTALGGFSTGLSTVHTSVPIPGFQAGVPRIDGPDQTEKTRWATVYSMRDASSERIYAAVKNEFWIPGVSTLMVHVSGGSTADNRPVLAYDRSTDVIYTGWISGSVVGYSGQYYVGKNIQDPGTVAPVVVPASYALISNSVTGSTPVLAFSGQNTKSDFNGLHIAYAQFNTLLSGAYSMTYKNKPFSFPFYKAAESPVTPAVYPNPFINNLSLVTPLKGYYDISITGIDGKLVYRYSGDYEAMQQVMINTNAFGSGIYILRMQSAENQLDYSTKLVK